MNNKTDIEKALRKLANPQKAKILGRFFKTGKDEYGEGDIFLGITVPQQRQITKQFSDLTLPEITTLLKSKIHEYRLTALLILVSQFKKADEAEKKQIYDLYLKNTRNINNWDLVDLTAPTIVGKYLINKDQSILYRMAKSNLLWDRRIAVLATFEFIKNNRYSESLRLAKMLIDDKHDLIHKAVGWMLREIGKRDLKTEEKFLGENYQKMPRTMLRYAIEKFPPEKRKYYLR